MESIESTGPSAKQCDTENGALLLRTVSHQEMEIHEDVENIEFEQELSAPDGGWGWLVVFGSLMIHIILFGIEKSSGILLKKFKEKFHESSSATAWVATLPAGLRLMFAPICSMLINKYQFRPAVIAGAVLMSVSLLLTAFSTNLTLTFGSFAIIGGIGACLVYTPSVVIVGRYFNMRRGLAVGIATSSFGSFLFPTLIEFLFDYFGFVGAFLMLAGIALNMMVFGSVFRPLKLLEPPKSKTICLNDKETLSSCVVKEDKTGGLTPPLLLRRHSSSSYFCSKTCTSLCNYKGNLIGILGNYRFTSFCIAILMFSIAFHSAYAFIPLYAVHIGIDDRQSTYIIAVTILADGIGRIGIGAVLDIRCIKQYRIMLYSLTLILVGVVSITIPSARTLTQLGIVCSLYGILMGGVISQKSVIVVDILGVKKLANAFGILSFFQGIGVFIGPPVSGLLRDMKGDYSDGFYFGGGATVTGAFIFTIANIIHILKTKHFNST
ncbi:monocarboxylate transporter 9-like isoform X2 [Mizuhopecten yessoensis]|uniref:Monocarboxylate transporter 9 n=2 Tax=Mizuhopecten yessoensis TaxID=6573 RepID=A0A210QFM8_MIZYE|nr:monocarboxylate transporter 9-like isoform X2 [Mizuhopecten yessoensis]OWF47509.1 Monocarboxylate transporter 9 [Mizuhopecten yessoensis]